MDRLVLRVCEKELDFSYTLILTEEEVRAIDCAVKGSRVELPSLRGGAVLQADHVSFWYWRRKGEFGSAFVAYSEFNRAVKDAERNRREEDEE